MSSKPQIKNLTKLETVTNTSNSESEFKNNLSPEHKEHSTQPTKKYKKSNIFLFLMILIGFILTGAGGFYLGTMQNSPSQNTKPTEKSITTKPAPPKESQNPIKSDRNDEEIEIDWPPSVEDIKIPNATGILTDDIKKALKKIIESESYTFTDRKFFTVVVYENWKDGWIDAAIAAPKSKNFITAQGEPYSRILMKKTPNGWIGHLDCAPGYLQMEFDFSQSKYQQTIPELTKSMKSTLEKNPNSPGLHCLK